MAGGRKDIVVNIDARFNAVANTAREIHRFASQVGDESAREYANSWISSLSKGNGKIERAIKDATNAVSRHTEYLQLSRLAHQELTDATTAHSDAVKEETRVLKDNTATLEEQEAVTRRRIESKSRLDRATANAVRTIEQETRANNAVSDSVRRVMRAQDDAVKENSFGQGVLSMGKYISALRAIALPTTTTIAIGFMGQLAGIAASAAQSLYLLPGAAAAASAGIGTLSIATMGFGDAIKDIGDAEKFAEALQKLSPNAQQAALSIQAIMPQLTELKNATQDALFADFAPMINRLADQYLPTLEKLTTGVAGAFNTAAKSLFDMLMRPEMQQTLNTIIDNVVKAFENLAPAVAPFTEALVKIAEVGSGVLPEIATAAARAAESFAEFINRAAESGDLDRWLRDGLETVSELGETVKQLGRIFFGLSGVGKEILPDINRALGTIADNMHIIGPLIMSMGPAFATWEYGIKSIEAVFNGLKGVAWPVTETIRIGFEGVVKVINTALNAMRVAVDYYNSSPLGKFLKLPGVPLPIDPLAPTIGGNAVMPTGSGLGAAGYQAGKVVPRAGLPGVPAGGYPLPPPPADKGAAPAWTPPFFDPSLWQVGDSMIPVDALPGGMASPSGLQPNAANLNDIISAMFPMMPSAGGWRPPDGFNEHSSGEAVDFMTGGDFALGDAINAFILQNAEALGVQYTIWRQMMHYADGRTSLMEDRGSPTQNHMDHVHARVNAGPASAAGLAFPGAGAGGMAAGMMGGYVVDPEAVMRAEAARLTAKNDLEQKRLRLLELQAKGDATQRELLTAQNDVAEAERRFNIALLDEQQARRGKYKELDGQINSAANSIGQIGAALANDFGISEGLPGIAKWLTTFMANLAFAPAIGALSAVTAMSPIQGGYGMMGMMGANAMASGTYPGMGGMPMMPMMPGAAMMGPTPLGGGVGPGLMPGVTPPAVNGMLHGGLGGVPGVGNAAPVGGGGAGFGIPGVGPFGMAPRSIGGLGGPMLGGGMQIGAAGAGTALTSRSPTPGSGGGFQGFGGSGIGALAMQGIQTGLAGAGMAADLMGAGGAGSLAAQAAQTSIELANRTSGYIGQLAGIGVSGLLETFLPNNSQAADPSKSWFGRIASGLSGARPALPNTAGAAPAQQPKPQADAQQQPGGPLIGAINNYTADSGQTIAKEIDRHRLESNMAGAPRPK